MGGSSGSSGRAPALQVLRPEIKPESHQKVTGYTFQIFLLRIGVITSSLVRANLVGEF
jgi:hypothetical protein